MNLKTASRQELAFELTRLERWIERAPPKSVSAFLLLQDRIKEVREAYELKAKEGLSNGAT